MYTIIIPYVLETYMDKTVFITEGKTHLLVPKSSDDTPAKHPVFFNPRACVNRDMSLLAYAALSKEYSGDLTYIDSLCGLGARGLRVANELNGFENVILNDVNPNALMMAEESAIKNKLQIKFSNQKVCRFLATRSETGMHAMVTDIDPFGSPAKYFECAVRSVAHGGMLSATATDLQVLRGIFNLACVRRYGGSTIRRTEFGIEIGVRLILGCLGHICARIDRSFEPLFVHCDQHYYRVYVRIKKHPSSAGTGYMYSCIHCGNRGVADCANFQCPHCGKKTDTAGPLWIGQLFDENFTKRMIIELKNLSVNKICEKTLIKSSAESTLPPTFYTLDEVAKKNGYAPPKLANTINLLQNSGYTASPTSFDPTGFRTNATFEQILACIF
ncbi:MAG: tRNA (Guanine-N(2)-)-methyltransferase [Cenarchaeum symbiont of Oopsacas minuta]|nr:tRNA (Guanine-N(2)-)-methyltransferase [Cenarchaeum symbiont of Oopsacas minuta]